MKKFVILFLFLCLGCATAAPPSGNGGGGNGGSGGSTDNGGKDPSPQMSRFRVSNQCSYSIWVQQDNMPAGTPSVLRVDAGKVLDYEIPAAGLASTRFWPKTGCDAKGQNCTLGQSSPPCPAEGCAPPVDSKIEVTWGCTLADMSQCAKTPQGDTLGATFYNASAVDGYTLPFTVSVQSGGGNDCVDLDCSGLSFDQCPTQEDLSQGRTNTHPQYASEDLKITHPGSQGALAGCYSPCKKLNYPTWGGLNVPENNDAALLYCCPTPPISADECRMGPVPNTQYVQAIHQMCGGGVYGYAYDDGVGLHSCGAQIQIEMTFGPNCP